ncbi:MAG: hypothetical protein CVU11_01070 [Bacteroidetes bacterium HGW-Bacteroidetes-6]|jgi:hypothetical protein|nr:MAG: hypothetical protein CVU11_01070 [Bacteroidetes bacterium HGW-Bacteroidetes-6]
MKNILGRIFFALFVITAVLSACQKDDDNTDDPVVPVQTERERVLAEYNTYYLGSDLSDCGFTGDVNNCIPGTISQNSFTLSLMRINFFRRMVGLNDDITYDAIKSAKCQQAALMMDANNSLNHYPPASWICYTQDGYDAASSSNLAMGTGPSGSISMYMNDFGSSNTAVGHRRWILYSRSKVMGMGSTGYYSALWVTGNSGNPLPANMPEYIPWPAKGYVPAPLIYGRWSFSKPSADFSNATVSMTDGGGSNISLSIVSTATGYGDNTIVWEPVGINTTSSTDVTYHVTVSNVLVSGSPMSYSYDVIIIQP